MFKYFTNQCTKGFINAIMTITDLKSLIRFRFATSGFTICHIGYHIDQHWPKVHLGTLALTTMWANNDVFHFTLYSNPI